MEIVKHIKKHTESLQKGFEKLSIDQIKQLKILALGFYFKLPHWQEVIEGYIKSPINKKKLIEDILDDSATSYKEIIEKCTAEVDEYADDYEEMEQVTIFILNAFENSVTENTRKDSLVEMYLDIINTLDHYENFSEEPEYWNQILEKEVEFQSELLVQLQSQMRLDLNTYDERYRNIKFPDLDA